jgi:anti-sigma-K factor RskA
MKILDEDARELLAAECALGVMKGRVQRRFRRLADGDADLRDKVTRWERQLNVLCEGALAVEAPASIWSNIERRLQRAAGLQRKEGAPAAPEVVPAGAEPSASPEAEVDLAAVPEPAAPESLVPDDEPMLDLQPEPSPGRLAARDEEVPPAEAEAKAPPARSTGNVVAEALSVIKGKILDRPAASRRDRSQERAALRRASGGSPELTLMRGSGPVRRIREDLGESGSVRSVARAEPAPLHAVPANDTVLLTDVATSRPAAPEDIGPEPDDEVQPDLAHAAMAPPLARPSAADELDASDDDLPPWPPEGRRAVTPAVETVRGAAADDVEPAPAPSRRRRERRRRKERSHRERDGTPATGALRLWQAFGIVAGLIAIGLVVYIALYGPGGPGAAVDTSVAPAPEAPTFVVPSLGPAAVLNGSRGEPVWLVHASGDGQIVEVHRLAQVELPLDQSLELWLLRGAEIPAMSLGVLARAGGTRITLPDDMAESVRTGEAFAVSLEPAGGSTTGEISGPIVQSGAIYHVR